MQRLKALTAATVLRLEHSGQKFKVVVCMMFAAYIPQCIGKNKENNETWLNVLETFNTKYKQKVLQGLDRKRADAMRKMWDNNVKFLSEKVMDSIQKLTSDETVPSILDKLAPNHDKLNAEQIVQATIQIQVISHKSLSAAGLADRNKLLTGGRTASKSVDFCKATPYVARKGGESLSEIEEQNIKAPANIVSANTIAQKNAYTYHDLMANPSNSDSDEVNPSNSDSDEESQASIKTPKEKKFSYTGKEVTTGFSKRDYSKGKKGAKKEGSKETIPTETEDAAKQEENFEDEKENQSVIGTPPANNVVSRLQFTTFVDVAFKRSKNQVADTVMMWNMTRDEKEALFVKEFQEVWKQVGQWHHNDNENEESASISIRLRFGSNDIMLFPFLSCVCGLNLKRMYENDTTMKDNLKTYVTENIMLDLLLTSNKPCVLASSDVSEYPSLSCLIALWHLSKGPFEDIEDVQKIFENKDFIAYCENIRQNAMTLKESIERRVAFLSEGNRMRAIGNQWVSHYSLQADEITRVVAALRSNNIETNDLKQIGPICFFNLRHIGMEVAAASMILLKTTNDETGMYTFQVLYDTSDKSLFSEKNPTEIFEIHRMVYFNDLASMNVDKHQVVVNGNDNTRFDIFYFDFFRDVQYREVLNILVENLIENICSSIRAIPASRQVALLKHYKEHYTEDREN